MNRREFITAAGLAPAVASKRDSDDKPERSYTRTSNAALRDIKLPPGAGDIVGITTFRGKLVVATKKRLFFMPSE